MATVNLKRIFAAGEEPSGERNSTFAKVIALEENPPFSGAFGHFILVRRLKTNKKYEIWILFAGYPIRSSLKEFAIVTWLDCGKIPSCSIEMVVDMLKNRKVKDRATSIKYACLAITSSSFISASHIDIAEKDEIALAQDSFALRGYVDAIQLVMIAAIPALKEEVVLNEPVLLEESESDTEMSAGDDTQTPVDVGEGDNPAVPARFVINPKNARDLNVECKVPVRSILDDPHEEWLQNKDFSWPDENSDTTVDTLVRLIGECFRFKNELFTGGLTVADIDQPNQRKRNLLNHIPTFLLLTCKITALESAVSSLQGVEDRINLTVSGSLKSTLNTEGNAQAYKTDTDVRRIIAELEKEAADTEVQCPSFSFGLTQDGNSNNVVDANPIESVKLSTQTTVSANEFFDIALRTQHMPTKINSPDNSIAICNTTLSPTLMRLHSRFLQTAANDRLKLKLFDDVFRDPAAHSAEKINFPFNIDQKHWVAVCVDRKSSSINVLDCNVSLKSDSMMKKEPNPIPLMFPYIGKDSQTAPSSVVLKPFSVSRPKGIPQYTTPYDSAAMLCFLYTLTPTLAVTESSMILLAANSICVCSDTVGLFLH
ncbi:unnamed protein product [Brassica oleracea]